MNHQATHHGRMYVLAVLLVLLLSACQSTLSASAPASVINPTGGATEYGISNSSEMNRSKDSRQQVDQTSLNSIHLAINCEGVEYVVTYPSNESQFFIFPGAKVGQMRSIYAWVDGHWVAEYVDPNQGTDVISCTWTSPFTGAFRKSDFDLSPPY